ncbi:MAG: D-aminoacyl-tRNA deacylase [Desulfotalea sp.]
MRAVIQRSKQASVTVNGEIVGEIDHGLVIFLGIKATDTEKDIAWLTSKIINLRIFSDKNDKMNLSLADTTGKLLIVSQFTLYGDCRKGRRPGYSQAAPPQLAERLYSDFVAHTKTQGIEVATGIFQADMDVQLINDGPVTLLLDTEKKF